MDYYVRLVNNHSIEYLASLGLDVTERILDEIQSHVEKNKEQLHIDKSGRARIFKFYGGENGEFPNDMEERTQIMCSYGFSKEAAEDILRSPDAVYQVIDDFGIIQYIPHSIF